MENREEQLLAAQNLARLRHERGLSQHELADLSGLHRPTISFLETGRQQLSLPILQRLAGPLGCTGPGDLLGRLLEPSLLPSL